MMTAARAYTHLATTDDGLVLTRSQDVEPIMNSVRARRDAEAFGSSDMRHVARVPTVLVEAAANEAGVDLSDKAAVREIIYGKIMSGEWAAFAVHPGGY